MPTLRRTVLAACGLVMFAALGNGARADEDEALTHARELLKIAILVDGHNDLPWAIRTTKQRPASGGLRSERQGAGQTDLERLRQGGLGAQFWSVYIPGEVGGGSRARSWSRSTLRVA